MLNPLKCILPCYNTRGTYIINTLVQSINASCEGVDGLNVGHLDSGRRRQIKGIALKFPEVLTEKLGLTRKIEYINMKFTTGTDVTLFTPLLSEDGNSEIIIFHYSGIIKTFAIDLFFHIFNYYIISYDFLT